MDKITYLAELAEGLARWVPERERQDILRYYAEYFEEAGPGREAEVMAELGDPWALSSRLAVEGGYVTQEQAASWRSGKRWLKVLLGTAVGLAVFVLVFNIGLLVVNITRTANGFAHNPDVFSEAEIVEWGFAPVEGEYVTFVDGSDLTYFYYTDGGNLSIFDSIDVDISLGNVEVVYADGYTLSIGRSEAMSGYDLTWEVRDGVLRLRDGGGSQWGRVNSWDDLKNLFGVDRWAVDVTITVPEGVTLDNVSVETGVGNVMLWGVSAETVTAETGVGNMECIEAWNARKLELTTGVGDVTLGMSEVRSGLNIRLESGTGNVEVNLACPESDCAYELESGLGIVTVNGGRMGSSAARKGSLPYRLNAESGTGSVNVWFN